MVLELEFRRGFIVVIKVVKTEGAMAVTKGLDMVFKGAFVFEVRTTKAIPNLAAILLVGSPIAFDSEGLGAFSTSEGLDAVLALVMRLKGAEILERPRPWVVDVVFAASRAAIAWEP